MFLILMFAIIFFFKGLVEKVFPSKISGKRGYRSNNSLKSQGHWDFAQEYHSNLIMFLSVFMIGFASVCSSSFQFSDNINLLISFLVIVLFLIFIRQLTERAIKNRFDD